MFLKLFVSIVALIGGGGADAQTNLPDRLRDTASETFQARTYSSDSESRLSTLNQAISENPQNPELQLRKGVYLLELGRTQQAIDVFEALRVEYPGHPAPYINLASVFAQQGRLEEARQMLMKSEALNAGRYETQLSLASINTALALEAIKKANEIHSGDPVTEKRVAELAQMVAKLNGAPPPATVSEIPVPVRVEKLQQAGRERPLAKPRKIGGNPVAPLSPSADRLTLNALITHTELAKRRSFGGDHSTRNRVMSEATDDARAEVMNTVESWASAWSRRDLVEYTSYYSSQFKAANGMSRDAWSMYKKHVIDRSTFIDIKVNIKQVKILKNKAWVQFSQRYRSDIHSDSVSKELKFIFENGSWKIIGEKSN